MGRLKMWHLRLAALVTNFKHISLSFSNYTDPYYFLSSSNSIAVSKINFYFIILNIKKVNNIFQENEQCF